MKRKFHHYSKWEDWHNGLYSQEIAINSEDLVEKSKLILSSTQIFYETAKKMVVDWEISSEQNLTDWTRNRRAWIGQASCCYSCGASENLVKLAWHQLNQEVQNKANRVADRIIKEFYMGIGNKQRQLW